MAGTNDFLPFATAGGANVLPQSAYAALAAVATGYQAGVAQSAQLNKTWRQSSIIASMVAQFIVDQTGANAVDDGTIAALEANFIAALRYAGVAVGTDTGSANTCVVNYTPAIPSLVDGMVLWFKAAAANTGATTLNVNGLGAKAVVGGAHSALQGGEIVANGKCMVVYNSTLNSFVLIECTGAALQVAPATASGHAMQLGQAVGRLIGVQIISATGTYTPTAGTTFVVAEGVGGGGAGSGTPATGASSGAACGGGGSGAYFRVLIRTGFSGVTVTIGAGGTGVSGVAGNNGGATSFGSLATAPGGSGIASPTPGPGPNVAGGASPSAIATASPGAGGVAIFLSRGLPGGYGVFAVNGNAISGAGAASVFGPGGASSVSGGGAAGTAPGSGGSGGMNNFGSAANAGGAGVAGQVIVWEYA